jgi:hypothetical protein
MSFCQQTSFLSDTDIWLLKSGHIKKGYLCTVVFHVFYAWHSWKRVSVTPFCGSVTQNFWTVWFWVTRSRHPRQPQDDLCFFSFLSFCFLFYNWDVCVLLERKKRSQIIVTKQRCRTKKVSDNLFRSHASISVFLAPLSLFMQCQLSILVRWLIPGTHWVTSHPTVNRQ